MADILTPEQRSALMSKIRSGDTKPEWILRTGLHRMGFRYALRNRKLPGSPDLVFRKHRAVVFVHGCFWHHHRKGRCRRASTPRNNQEFWREKFETNRRRDQRNLRELRKIGWRAKAVWECDLIDRTIPTILAVAEWLEGDGRCQHRKKRQVSYLDRDRKSESRSEILRVAEERVRYRIDSYG